MSKVKAIKDSINLYEGIMRETQSQIRQKETVLEQMKKQYKRATEERSHLQAQLIEELEKKKASQTKLDGQ